MTRPGFFEGVAVAALASTTAGLLHAVLPLFLHSMTASKFIVLVLGGGYVVYLLRRTTERAGRLITGLIWLCLAAVLWLSGLSSAAYLAGHLVSLWLVRALYFQTGPLSAALDGLLMVVGVLLGAGAYLWSDSVFAATWTFFLIQALFTLVAYRPDRHSSLSTATDATRFETAYRSAEAALNQLSTQHHS